MNSLGPGTRFSRWLMLFILFAGGFGTLYFGLRISIADLLSVGARWELSQWPTKPGGMPSEADWDRVHAAYLAALAWTPHDPQLHEGLGYQFSLQAYRPGNSPQARRDALMEALAANRRATESRPMSPYAWSNVALLLSQLGENGPALWDAYDRAYRYGWREAPIRLRLAEICFSRWDDAGGERQSQLNQMIVGLPKAQRKELLDLAIRFGRYHWLVL
jgi:hypothetical protein